MEGWREESGDSKEISKKESVARGEVRRRAEAKLCVQCSSFTHSMEDNILGSQDA